MPTRISTAVMAAAIAVVALVLLAGCGGAGRPDPRAGDHPTRPGLTSYVALGDSYTAAPFVPVTDANNRCLRSDHNYPHLLAKALHAKLTDVSCSGATTAHMVTAQLPTAPPQLDAITRDTDLVTISIGGNDLNTFGALVRYCPQLAATDPTGAPCRARFGTGPGSWLDKAMAAVTKGVEATVRGARERAPDARIVVIDYPQIVPLTGTCTALPLASGDYSFARTINRRLDEAVIAGARSAHAGARTLDLWALSASHALCSKTPWVNGPRLILGRAAAYHPFLVEQQAVARLLEAELKR